MSSSEAAEFAATSLEAGLPYDNSRISMAGGSAKIEGAAGAEAEVEAITGAEAGPR